METPSSSAQHHNFRNYRRDALSVEVRSRKSRSHFSCSARFFPPECAVCPCMRADRIWAHVTNRLFSDDALGWWCCMRQRLAALSLLMSGNVCCDHSAFCSLPFSHDLSIRSTPLYPPAFLLSVSCFQPLSAALFPSAVWPLWLKIRNHRTGLLFTTKQLLPVELIILIG